MKTKAEVREQFDGYGYPIHIVGRHLEITDAMKAYAIEKLSKIERFGGHVLEATITMDIQKVVHTVAILVNVNNTRIKVSGVSDNMYASVDLAIDHLKSKLSRYVRRLHEHHAKGRTIEQIPEHVFSLPPVEEMISDSIEDENLRASAEKLRPRPVVSLETRPLKILNQEEAIMKLELDEDAGFYLYKDEETHALRILYRRGDGNYGIIQVS